MIRKLRIKLILASMLSLLLVLTIIFGAVGILNYKKILADADSILSILQENDGSFPMNDHPKNDTVFSDIPPREEHRFSAELPYESRYFSVFLLADGTVISVNTGKIAAVDTSTAIEYAQSVIKSGDEQGFVKDYRYTVYTADNEMHVIFLDYGREMSSFRTFLFTGAGVSLVGLLAVMLLLIFFSGRIVKPFSENYEKQKQFITDAGHELKTPLTIIDADAEVLEMDMGKNEWLSDIQVQTKRLAQLTNSLIQLSRMEEQPQVEKIEFPLSDVVEETVETFQALAKTQNKNLSGRIQPMLSMNGDEKAIRQLVTILMDNAVKYSDDGGRIELTLEKQNNSIQLSVFNTANYISKENLPHYFDRFYRADPSRNSKTGGYGLGLPIASAIVAAHRGKIWATTLDEKSLQIIVSLPVN
ncbi:two-component sensor histidine kinase [Hydrogeniiclostridium mannosilyticum]|uniref:histidine kinase n=2 Tax=Hydrogeniiclostridium mannosilyticum TaxID=2764322 RepID=A0A328UEV9_9FIRM|nr:HAMP domain-containing sensor histidine kinase [Hydrogeniiclostridium mannosilyticum]RAQ30038.1 two-component sensor histidine kinase [Hydrogeniiclostridium mannosilyticum]